MALIWRVSRIDRVASESGLDDVCKKVHWIAVKTEVSGGIAYKGDSTGVNSLAEPDSKSFIPYADIKETDAINWVKTLLGSDGITAVEEEIDKKLLDLKQVASTRGVPW